jgi:hypothetical protein
MSQHSHCKPQQHQMHGVVCNCIDKARKCDVDFPVLVFRFKRFDEISSVDNIQPFVCERPSVDGEVTQKNQRKYDWVEPKQKETDRKCVNQAMD